MTTQDAVVTFLSDPAAYGVAGPVERVETHISIVFLAGDRAWKLKRAVRTSYLDFSTVERRRAACEAEMAMNRRTAPELYLEVRAVRRTPDGALTLGGKGEPVDWLVVMRRFDQSALLDRMAETGRLDLPLARAVADAVADLHDQADAVLGHGGRAGIEAATAITETNLALRPERLPSEAARRWSAGIRAEIARRSTLLEARRRGGSVRAGHGDLHLRNICLIDGRPVLFDGIEFDPSLAAVDVLYDLAFLLMDLLHRDEAGLAAAVLNRYLDRRDEVDGLAALPLFLSLRAAIRAQVTAAKPADPAGEAGRYLTLALQLLAPPAPRLVAVGGFSGTGKSTLAGALAPAIGPAPGARVLRSDVLRKRRAGVAETARLPAVAYTPESHGQVYAALGTAAAAVLAAGHGVIADAVFGDPDERQAIEAVARRAGVGFVGLWLSAPPEVLARRVRDRKADASDATPAVLAAQLARGAGRVSWVPIDAGASPAACLAAARAVLASA